MEEIEFQQWIESLQEIKNEYSVVFNPSSMKIIRVGPRHALKNEENCIDVDADIAESILSGEVSIHSCYLDSINGEIAITETKNLTKIDDVLHRVPEISWSSIETPDVYLKFDTEKDKITIQLAAHWGGTHSFNNVTPSTRKIIWSGDTIMEFLVTDYNDPHILYDTFNFTIQDLIKNQLEYIINAPTTQFSVYTKRIFKNYVMEIE